VTQTSIAILAYPAMILGAVLVFAFSSQIALGLFASNVQRFVSPAPVNREFNLPPPVQIGEIYPKPTPKASATAANATTGSFTKVPLPDGSSTFSVGAPTDSPITAVTAPNSARIGTSAVNLRSGPSKTAPVLGVLAAGTPVTTSGIDKGWVMVSADGRTGWVYKTYLEGLSVSITVSGGVATAEQ
jgi:hypothetical protein